MFGYSKNTSGNNYNHKCNNNGNGCSWSNPSKQSKNRPKCRLSPVQLRDFNLNCKCSKCGKYGHWSVDHNSDGMIKYWLPTNDAPPQSTNSQSSQSANPSQAKQSTINFQMANTGPDKTILGPKVDSGAPYSSIGWTELCVLLSCSLETIPDNIYPLPDNIIHYKWWQYGAGYHSSDKRRIIGAINIECASDSGRTVSICHIVVAGSSQWVVGRNVTRLYNHLNINNNRLQLPLMEGSHKYISLIYNETHRFITHNCFTGKPGTPSISNRPMVSLSGHSINGPTNFSMELSRPLSDVSRIVSMVNDHVCGHATYGDMRTLLQRNRLWNDYVQRVLATVVETCARCNADASPPLTGNVSISGSNRNFNDVVFIDPFWLDNICMFHMMDSFSRYSLAQPVNKKSLFEAIVSL